jgi:hypothetical protein
MILEGNQSDWNKVIGAFTVAKFIRMLSQPFNRMDAYKLGIIDSKGKFIKKIKDLKTQKEKKSVDAFNRMIIGMKKVISTHQNPRLRAMMSTLPTALKFLSDEVEKVGGNGEEVILEIKEYLNEEYGIVVPDENHFDELFKKEVIGE